MNFSCETFYRSLLLTVAEAKSCTGGAVCLFVVGALLGAVSPDLGHPLLAALQQLAQDLAGRGTAELALFIFLRNATAAAVAVVTGIVVGIVPALAAVGNGLLFGAVLNLVPGEIWKILPHGIFELPAMFTAWGLGLWLGQWPLGPDPFHRLRQRLGAALRAYFGAILPLLAIAAVIEAIAALHLF